MTNTIIRIAISLAIIFGAYKLGEYIISTKQDPKSKPKTEVIPQVDTVELTPSNYSPAVRSFGNVQSYFETTLTPQVSGRIVDVSPQLRVGQMVSEGEILAQLDQTDYIAALATQKANLTLQKRAQAEEIILAEQAASDWKASGRQLASASDFVLRKPQLQAAQANIDSVEAAIVKAKADLQRTKIIAPYNAVVTERLASVGNFATAQSSLGKLVATEKAEVRIPLTAEQLKRVKFSKDKKPVLTLTVPSDAEQQWQAELTQMDPTVDAQNQVSYAIATIHQPYKSKTRPLPIGSFVNVSLPGIEIKQAYKVPEAALVNDSYLWIVGQDDKLVRVQATRVQSEDAYAFVKIDSEEIKPPLMIVTRPLSTFRSGIKVELKKDTAIKAEQQS